MVHGFLAGRADLGEWADVLPYSRGSLRVTVAELHEDGVTVALIPHTLAVTTLGTTSVGDPVNLEVDIIAKYVERILAYAPRPK